MYSESRFGEYLVVETGIIRHLRTFTTTTSATTITAAAAAAAAAATTTTTIHLSCAHQRPERSHGTY